MRIWGVDVWYVFGIELRLLISLTSVSSIVTDRPNAECIFKSAVAVLGALFFSRLADRIGTKRAVMVTLALWSGVVIYAYFIVSAVEFFVLGLAVGVVLGSSQSLSRSFYASMIPEEASAEFYGFYTVFSKFSAIWGPLVFAVIRQVSGSSRISIVSLIIFFILGLILLSLVDEEKARASKKAIAF